MSKIEPLQESLLPDLSRFLTDGFCPPGSYCDFASPEVLSWAFLEPRGPWTFPRSYVVTENNRILAHMGLFTTAFGPTPAVHMVNWLTSDEASSFGALLMMRAFSLAPVTYAFGCTPAAARVLVRAGYELLFQAPIYNRVVHRTRGAVWHELHGTNTVARAAAFLGVDLVQSFRPTRKPERLTLRSVVEFGPEAEEILQKTSLQVTFTSRAPEVLNHYLRFPQKNFHGFYFEDHKVRGFGLIAVIQKPKLRLARIVDCFLDTDDRSLWADAISLLHHEALKQNPDVISCYGTTGWMTEALKANGFFRRGKTAFYLRDPKKLVPRDRPFHLTYLEADTSYI